MKQQRFEEKYGPRWQRFERELKTLESKELSLPTVRRQVANPHAPETPADFPKLYREICRDLSLAVQRRYTPQLLDRLNALALGGHRQLYWRNTNFGAAFVRFVAHGFPARVRADWAFVATSAALFALPGLLLFALALLHPELVYSVIPPEQMSEFESMYDPASRRIGSDRGAASDIQMFGFYIFNNIGISFRTFATGIAWGIGSAFFLLTNGLLFGALSAHIIHLGFEQTFFPFVIGHSSVELTGIILSGAAGLKLGYALIAPGRHTRVDALRQAASESVQLVYGVIAMLVLAALCEAFWSSKSSIPYELKLAVGSLLWMLVLLYFMLLGRSRPERRGEAT
jgi:uncharacterized membrane protein SpoIIM required for sporulation